MGIALLGWDELARVGFGGGARGAQSSTESPRRLALAGTNAQVTMGRSRPIRQDLPLEWDLGGRARSLSPRTLGCRPGARPSIGRSRAAVLPSGRSKGAGGQRDIAVVADAGSGWPIYSRSRVPVRVAALAPGP